MNFEYFIKDELDSKVLSPTCFKVELYFSFKPLSVEIQFVLTSSAIYYYKNSSSVLLTIKGWVCITKT